MPREQSAPVKLCKVRRQHTRGNTLLQETAAAIAKDIWSHSCPAITALPADLAQILLDELITMQKLTRSSLALFAQQYIYRLSLEEYPGLTDGWLTLLSMPSLLFVDLSGSPQVLLLVISWTQKIPHNYPLAWMLHRSRKSGSEKAICSDSFTSS